MGEGTGGRVHGEAGGGPAPDGGRRVWDRRRDVELVLDVVYAVCAIVVVLDLVIPRVGHHNWERIVEFYPLYGFFGIVVLVPIAKLMRRVLMRPEDYYDASSRDG